MSAEDRPESIDADAHVPGDVSATGDRAAVSWGDEAGVPPDDQPAAPPDDHAAPAAVAPDVVAALAALDGAVDVLTGLDPVTLDGRQAAAITRGVASAASRLAVAAARLLPVVESDGIWAIGGARSFPIWVSQEHRVSVGTARAQVRLGRTLRDDLPITARAAAAGEITWEHARVLATLTPTSDQRREVLADRASGIDERFLVEQARTLTVDELRVLARQWAAYTDPDADDRGYVESCDRERLEMVRLGDLYDVSGQLTVEHGQLLGAALRAVTPQPAAGDDRTATQRRAQALADLARLTLDHGLAGSGRATRPRITVLTDHATFVAIAQRASTAEQGTPIGRATRTPPLATAVMLTGRAIAGGPQHEDGTPVPRALLDRIACDSEINRVIFGPASEVLDVGRAERTFTGSRRAAIVARDKHCRYPGCTAPPVLCEGHHIRHWARDHGTTRVDQGVLLCAFHHGHVHRHHIEIRRRRARWVFLDARGDVIGAEVGDRVPDGVGVDHEHAAGRHRTPARE